MGRPAWEGSGRGRDRERNGLESGVLLSVRVRVKSVAGYWVGFSNFYFYSLISFNLISLIEISLV